MFVVLQRNGTDNLNSDPFHAKGICEANKGTKIEIVLFDVFSALCHLYRDAL